MRIIYFIWRLLQLPVRLIDYVVVHELSHLLEDSHTREFWQILDRTMPDWYERKRRLESDWQPFCAFRIVG